MTGLFYYSMILLSVFILQISCFQQGFGGNLIYKFNRYKSAVRAATDEFNSAISLSVATVKEEVKNGPIPSKHREFRINGWRWHTLCVLRDLERFEKVIQIEKDNISKKNLIDNSDRDIKQNELTQ